MRFFHTRLTEALKDPTTWAGFGTVAAGAAVVPAPWCYVIMATGVMSIILRAGEPKEPA